VPKGKKLLARALPLLTPDHINHILLSYIRNFGLFLEPPKGSEEDLSNLYEHLIKSISSLTITHIIWGFQSLFYYYLQGAVTLLQFVQKKHGLRLIQALLKRAHDIISEELNTTNSYYQPFINAWQEIYSRIFAQLSGQLGLLFPTDIAQWSTAWEFVSVIAANATPEQKKSLLSELRERMKAQLKISPWTAVQGIIKHLGVAASDL